MATLRPSGKSLARSGNSTKASKSDAFVQNNSTRQQINHKSNSSSKSAGANLIDKSGGSVCNRQTTTTTTSTATPTTTTLSNSNKNNGNNEPSPLSNSTTTTTTSTPTAVAGSSQQKPNTCDELSSMLDGSQETNRRPILRVNLIKKSTRQSNTFSALGRRRVQAAAEAAAAARQCDDDNGPPKLSTNPSADQAESKNQGVSPLLPGDNGNSDRAHPHEPKTTPTCNPPPKSDSSLATTTVVKNNTVAPSSKSSSSSRPGSNHDEAKNSQKLVLSLIKEISRTVSKEDLDEMLKEIHAAIGQVQQQQQAEQASPNVKQPNASRGSGANNNNSNNNGNSNSKKRQDHNQTKKVMNGTQRQTTSKESSLISASNKHTNKRAQKSNTKVAEQQTFNNSDASNSSETKEMSSFLEDEPDFENRAANDSKNSIQLSSESNVNKLEKVTVPRRQMLEFISDEDDTSKMGLSSGLDRKLSNSNRLPERCLRLTSSHAKYISPHRKRSLEERLSRAQEARERFLEYRANKFREILKKVEEMRAWKEEDTMNLKASVQTKLQKAEAKRKEQLDKIIRKAHDEDSKVSEIQFINNLEAQNRRHDMNSRKKEFEARLQDLQDERQRRFEEKQAKEVAAEERRKTLEAERKAKLLEIQQRRKLKNQKVEQQQQVKEKKRIEKNRDREEKITAIKEAYNAGVQTLKKRINQKQEQSERRHEVNLRLIRQKAFELSIKRYNSFISELHGNHNKQPTKATSLHASDSASANSGHHHHNHKQKENSKSGGGDTRRLQLKPFNTKKFCNLCKETISSELALFSHLRSEAHHSSINEHYGNTMLTTNEAVEIHNLRHIVDTDEPLDSSADKGANNSDDQQSSRASSLVNYYHSSYLSQANGGICMSESDRDSLLAIERKCRKLRHKLIVAGRPFNRDWFTAGIRSRLAQLLIQQRVARNQTTNTEATSLANTIDLSANNSNCQQNKAFYLKINRITRELISVTTDQRISGGGLMPAGIIHSVDRLLADLNKQLNSRKVPHLSAQLLYSPYRGGGQQQADKSQQQSEVDADKLALATKMIESYAIDTLYLYDIVSCLVSILRRIVPNVSLTSKLPSTVASHYSTLIDPISLNSYYCHRSPVLPARIYIRMIGLLQSLCVNHSDLCYIVFQSNNMIFLSDILSYRLGFIIGNESPASSISGSSSAATLSAQTIERKQSKQQQQQQGHGSTASSAYPVPKSPVASSSASGAGTSGKFQSSVSGGAVDCYGGGQKGAAADEDNEQEEENDEEGDLWEQRAETYKRTEEIVDDMTAGLCKLLATVTETILSRPLVLLNQLDKMAFDQRSDDFISYMVSVGIVDTESVIMSHIHQQQHHQQHTQQQQQHHHQQQQSHQRGLSPSSGGGGSSNISAITTSGPASSANVDKCADSGAAGRSDQSAGAADAVVASSMAASCALPPPPANSATGVPSASNKIINFTTSCIQFVTSLVKLVAAKLPDEMSERPLAQQDTTQLLATLKMTQLSGVLTLVYDMLVHSFHSLARSPAPNAPDPSAEAPPARQLGLALHSLRLINHVAYIDLELLQATLAADEMLPLQLRHVCGYLISYLVQSQFRVLDTGVVGVGGATPLSAAEQQQGSRPSAAAAASATQLGAVADAELPDENLLKNELMNEIILLLGNFAHLNQDNQLTLMSGRRPTIIEQLVGLPFDYFSRARLKLVLIPTLISCAYPNEQVCRLVSQELSLSMLTAFIEDQLLAAQIESKSIEAAKRQLCLLVADELTNTKLISNRWRFERRFPKSKWLAAKKYFEAQLAKQRQATSAVP